MSCSRTHRIKTLCQPISNRPIGRDSRSLSTRPLGPLIKHRAYAWFPAVPDYNIEIQIGIMKLNYTRGRDTETALDEGYRDQTRKRIPVIDVLTVTCWVSGNTLLVPSEARSRCRCLLLKDHFETTVRNNWVENQPSGSFNQNPSPNLTAVN